MHSTPLLCAALLLSASTSVGCATSAAQIARVHTIDTQLESSGSTAKPLIRSRCSSERLIGVVDNAPQHIPHQTEATFTVEQLPLASLEFFDLRDDKRSETIGPTEPWWESDSDRTTWIADRESFVAARGWYLGLGLAAVQISDSDLNGVDSITRTADTIELANTDTGFGGSIVFGYRHDNSAFELSFLRTEHDAEFMGTDHDATYKSFGLTLKHYFLPEQHLQPFISLGFANTELEIDDGSTMGANTEDAIFEDEFSASIGAGFSFFFTSRLSLNAQAEYRLLHEFDQANGVDPKSPIPDVDASGLTLIGSLTYIF